MASFAQLGGLTIHYRKTGNSKPCIVFINSLGSDFRIWEKVAARFEADFQVLCYDQRGHGLSDAPEGPYTLRDHGQDLGRLLDYLQIPSAILVGISVGGLIAQDFAITYPERTQALVLCDTGAKIGTAESWESRIEAVQAQGLGEVAKTVIQRWFTPAFFEQYPALAQGYYNMLSRTPEAGYIGTCAALRDADLRPLLGQIEAPSLALCGEADLSTPPSLAQELAQTLGCSLELIPGAGHLPCIEQPQAMSQHIRAFLEEIGYAGQSG